MNFETSKWLEDFKNQLNILKEKWEIKQETSPEKLFLAVKKVQEKIKNLTKQNISQLKESITNKKFIANENHDLAKKIKKKYPELYQKIIFPKWFTDQFISAWFGIANSFYKTWIWVKTILEDLIKLSTFQVSFKDIKEQFKRV
jgi:hypothetical protein